MLQDKKKKIKKKGRPLETKGEWLCVCPMLACGTHTLH
jgi:hypothetical protein